MSAAAHWPGLIEAYREHLPVTASTPVITLLEGNTPLLPERTSMAEIPAQTPESVALSNALRKRGFGFVGPTICYAFMQSAGLVNDHLLSCPARRVAEAR